MNSMEPIFEEWSEIEKLKHWNIFLSHGKNMSIPAGQHMLQQKFPSCVKTEKRAGERNERGIVTHIHCSHRSSYVAPVIKARR